MRYIFNNPFAFAEELLRIALIYLAMLGISYGIGLRKHISLVFLREKTQNTRYGFLLSGSIDLIVAAFLAVFFVIGGFHFARSSLGSLTPVLQWNKGYVYAIIPVSGIIGIMVQLLGFVEDLRYRVEK